MNEKSNKPLLGNLSCDISQILGSSLGLMDEVAGHNRMGFSFLKTRRELLFARLNSPIRLKATTSARTSTVLSSNTSSDEAQEKYVVRRLLDGMTAQYNSLFAHALKEVSCPHHRTALRLTPSLTGIKIEAVELI